MKQERTKKWVHVLFWAVLTVNSQRSSSTGYTPPHELFNGGRTVLFVTAHSLRTIRVL